MLADTADENAYEANEKTAASTARVTRKAALFFEIAPVSRKVLYDLPGHFFAINGYVTKFSGRLFCFSKLIAKGDLLNEFAISRNLFTLKRFLDS